MECKLGRSSSILGRLLAAEVVEGKKSIPSARAPWCSVDYGLGCPHLPQLCNFQTALLL